ncbi:MAG: hypothetical protein ACHQF2_08020 [Flavobacteriales bacterium]
MIPMKTKFIFIGLAVMTVFSCSNSDKQPSASDLKTDVDPKVKVKPSTPIRTLVYGSYCGRCKGRCAVMYKVFLTGNTWTLHADTTNAFFRSPESLKFEVHIPDTAMVRAAGGLQAFIPKRLLESDKTEQRFGCPDCSDQCGYYVEIEFDDAAHHKKKLYLDTHTNGLKNDVVALIQALDALVAKMLF